jgi:hypothetical protein
MNNPSSSIAVYNEIVDSHPELLEPLYRSFLNNIRGTVHLEIIGISLLNSYTVLQNRDEFVDFDNSGKKRLLFKVAD